jgi:hypothetical protein
MIVGGYSMTYRSCSASNVRIVNHQIHVRRAPIQPVIRTTVRGNLMPKNEIQVDKTLVATAIAMRHRPGVMTDIHRNNSTATRIRTGCIMHPHLPHLLGLCIAIGVLITVPLHLIKRASAVHRVGARRPRATTSLAAVVGDLHPLQDLAQKTLMQTNENIANEID